MENTAMDVPWQQSQVVREDFRRLQEMLGPPLQLDAAQFGSRAHRLRCYWTNLAPQQQMEQALGMAVRPVGRLVQDILGPGRRCRQVQRTDSLPFYVCNVAGQPMQALPTLMATVGSYAFVGKGQGVIWDGNMQRWTEPTVEEREVALGYAMGSTAAPGVTQKLRHQVLGRCMDSNVTMALVAVAGVLAGKQLEPAAVQVGVAAGAGFSGEEGCWESGVSWQQLAAVMAAAEQQEAVVTGGGGEKDIWRDGAAMQLLQTGQQREGLSRKERSRAQRRIRAYKWQQRELQRRLPDGSWKVVPRPEHREGIIQQVHERTGHYGVQRTAQMVLTAHWWRSLHADVADVLRRCQVCDRVRASFGSLQPQLHPLPIEPMFYRWGFDLAGEFPVTVRGHKWVLIAVEHFSKHIELIPLRDKSAGETTAAATEVLCRFGAPAELVTDGGGEWGGAFTELLSSCFVDHRITSPMHPQANGLAERVVQVVKKALRKLCETHSTTQWDQQLPWVALGYRCSKQSSTGCSPYELLYARQPVLPAAVRVRMEEPLDFDSQQLAADSLLRRSEWLKERIPVAMANLKAAQHRDVQRYQQLRSKGYLPKVAAFLPGDLVYLKRPKVGSTLVIKARPAILRVKAVHPGGVVVLQDRAGQEFKQQASQLSQCHLPDVDDSIDRLLQGVDQEAECVVCGSPDDGHVFMFCDHCNLGWHTYCCTPPLAKVPEGHFLCERCRAEGVTLQDLQEQQQVRERLQEQPAAPDLFPLADKRRRDERAAALHGRYVVKRQGRDAKWGVVHFGGPGARPFYFKVPYADGSLGEGLSYRMVTAGKAYRLQGVGAQPPEGVQLPRVNPLRPGGVP